MASWGCDGNLYLSFCFTLPQRCSTLQLREVLGQQNIQEQLCISAEQGNRIAIGFFIVIKRLY